MLGSYDIFVGDNKLGVLTVSQSGLMTMFSARCEKMYEGVLRLAINCGDRYVILGVLYPQDGDLCFCRKYSKLDLKNLGLDHIEGCEIMFDDMDNIPRRENPAPQKQEILELQVVELEVPQDMGWQLMEAPSELFDEEELIDACVNVAGAMVREENDIKYLAIPVGRDIAFPMMPIFCFGESEEILGKDYIVFKIKNKKLFA